MDTVSNTPSASVVIVAYNAGKYLQQAIESVLQQTFSDFELLLLDDGSSDNSLQIMESFAARDDRCRVFSGPNRGIVEARNAGLASARAEFIVTMDADDVCHPQRIEKQLTFLKDNPDCVAVGSRALYIDPEGLPLAEMIDCFSHSQIDHALMSKKIGMVHPSTTIRKSALDAIGGYHHYLYAEDLDLLLRLAEIGRLENLKESLLRYRQHIGSISYRHKIEQTRAATRAIIDAGKRRGLPLLEVTGNLLPPAQNETIPDIHRRWGWWALTSGNLEAARKHAFRALRLQPVSIKSWRLAACAVRGH
jgi:glycosyltransferase involved in cell wall biosynthesis